MRQTITVWASTDALLYAAIEQNNQNIMSRKVKQNETKWTEIKKKQDIVVFVYSYIYRATWKEKKQTKFKDLRKLVSEMLGWCYIRNICINSCKGLI